MNVSFLFRSAKWRMETVHWLVYMQMLNIMQNMLFISSNKTCILYIKALYKMILGIFFMYHVFASLKLTRLTEMPTTHLTEFARTKCVNLCNFLN